MGAPPQPNEVKAPTPEPAADESAAFFRELEQFNLEKRMRRGSGRERAFLSFDQPEGGLASDPGREPGRKTLLGA